MKKRSPVERWDDLIKSQNPGGPNSGSNVGVPTSPPHEKPLQLPTAGGSPSPAPYPNAPSGFRPPVPVHQPDQLPKYELDQPPMKYKGTPPAELRGITEISPFPDYKPAGTEPNQKSAATLPEFWAKHNMDKPFQRRSFEDVLYTWEASNLYHNPLYFQDAPLERYGHTYHPVLQPFMSVKLFTVQLLGLPYQMTIDPIHKKMYTLGWYRPGECVPQLYYQVPWNKEAGAVETGVATGLFFLFP